MSNLMINSKSNTSTIKDQHKKSLQKIFSKNHIIMEFISVIERLFVLFKFKGKLILINLFLQLLPL